MQLRRPKLFWTLMQNFRPCRGSQSCPWAAWGISAGQDPASGTNSEGVPSHSGIQNNQVSAVCFFKVGEREEIHAGPTSYQNVR